MSMFEKRTHPAIQLLFVLMIVLTILFVLLPILTWDPEALPPEQGSETLVLYADYAHYGNAFETARDIRVSAEPDFAAPLRRLSASPMDGAVWRYVFEWKDPASQIYISPPVLYVPAAFQPVSVVLNGAPEETHILYGGEAWFTVVQIYLREEPYPQLEDQLLYTATLSVHLHRDLLPRSPQLTVDGQTVMGSSNVYFDEDASLGRGELLFQFSAPDAEAAISALEQASLTIHSALTRITAADVGYTSDEPDLEMIVSPQD